MKPIGVGMPDVVRPADVVIPDVCPRPDRPGRFTNWIKFIRYSVLDGTINKMHEATDFKQPVNPVALNVPQYHTFIKRPMDLKTIRLRISNKYYYDGWECLADLLQMLNNAYIYNAPGTLVHENAKKVHLAMIGKLAEMPEVEEEIPSLTNTNVERMAVPPEVDDDVAGFGPILRSRESRNSASLQSESVQEDVVVAHCSSPSSSEKSDSDGENEDEGTPDNNNQVTSSTFVTLITRIEKSQRELVTCMQKLTNILNDQMVDISSLSAILRGNSSKQPKIQAQRKVKQNGVSSKKSSQKGTKANSSCNGKTKNGPKSKAPELTPKGNVTETSRRRLSNGSTTSNLGSNKIDQCRKRKRDESKAMTASELKELNKVLKELPALTVEKFLETIQRDYYEHIADLGNWPSNLGTLPPFIQWELRNKAEYALLKVKSISPLPEMPLEGLEPASTEAHQYNSDVELELNAEDEDIPVPTDDLVASTTSIETEEDEREKENNNSDEKNSSKDEQEGGIDDGDEDLDLY